MAGGLKELYFKLEDKYYSVIDKVDKILPVYKVIDPIDEVVPSFAIILLASLLVIGWLAAGTLGANPERKKGAAASAPFFAPCTCSLAAVTETPQAGKLRPRRG